MNPSRPKADLKFTKPFYLKSIYCGGKPVYSQNKTVLQRAVGFQTGCSPRVTASIAGYEIYQ